VRVAVRKLDGVRSVTVSLNDGYADILLTSQNTVTVERIREAIRRNGFSPREALDQAAKSGLSRFPVYEQSLDHVTGYVHLKDLIWAEESASLKEITRQTVLIPETSSLPDIYALLTKQRVHMAIVLDEHGGTAGLLTLEDVLEVIVGEIDDEYHFTNINIRKLGDQAWLVEGNTLLTDLNEQLGVDLRPNEAYTTIAGLVLAKLGHIPKVGESLVAKNLTFTVRSMDRLRIDRVLVSASS